MTRKIVILLILIGLLSGCSFWNKEPFPQELTGLWETDEPRYKGCSVEISEDQIIFSNLNEDYIDINTIKGVKKSVEENATVYHIDFENKEGLEYNFSLFYMKKGDKEIFHYKNQTDVLWVKR